MKLKRFIVLIVIKFKCDQRTIQHKWREGFIQLIIYDYNYTIAVINKEICWLPFCKILTHIPLVLLEHQNSLIYYRDGPQKF